MAENARRNKARRMLHKAGYKAGGHVTDEVEKGVHAHEKRLHKGEKATPRKMLKDGGHAEGAEPKHRADKLARGGKAKHGKGHSKVTVNVINAHPHPKPMPVPVPVPAGPPGGSPPGLMAGPPGGAGAGPMPPPPQGPMHRGGRARRARGGKTPEASQRDKKGGMPAGHFKRGGIVSGKNKDAGGGSALGRLEKAELPIKRK